MSQMVDQVNGYDVYAKRAECDEDGNNIKSTYATNDGPTLTAGNNITLTNENNALTIAATVPVTDVTVDGSSVVSNGTAVITMPEGVPASTSSDEGKVLMVDSNGDPTWEIFDGGIYKVIYNGTATNTITSTVNLYSCDEIRLFFSIGGMDREVSICLKGQSGTVQRVIKTYGRAEETATCNERWIQITFTSTSITLNATKRYQIGSVDDTTTTFSNAATSSATSSLLLLSRVVGVKYISNGAIQIEDAPSDGKVYARKDGAWVERTAAVETVLFNSSGSGTGVSSTTPITLSESIYNFESIKIVNRKGTEAYLRINGLSPDYYVVTFPYASDSHSNNLELITCTFTVDANDSTKLWYKTNRNVTITPASAVTLSFDATNQTSKIQYIIGINRIASA